MFIGNNTQYQYSANIGFTVAYDDANKKRKMELSSHDRSVMVSAGRCTTQVTEGDEAVAGGDSWGI
jgi:hypothetical protein